MGKTHRKNPALLGTSRDRFVKDHLLKDYIRLLRRGYHAVRVPDGEYRTLCDAAYADFTACCAQYEIDLATYAWRKRMQEKTFNKSQPDYPYFQWAHLNPEPRRPYMSTPSRWRRIPISELTFEDYAALRADDYGAEYDRSFRDGEVNHNRQHIGKYPHKSRRLSDRRALRRIRLRQDTEDAAPWAALRSGKKHFMNYY